MGFLAFLVDLINLWSFSFFFRRFDINWDVYLVKKEAAFSGGASFC